MALSFASISGAAYPAWFSALQASLGPPIPNACELNQACYDCISFSRISGAAYPEWLSALQASLWQPILNGCELLKHLVQPILNSCELNQAFCDSLPCMAVSVTNIFGAACPEWPWAFQTSLGHISWMSFSFSSISGTAYPAWLLALQASLGLPILNGWACQASLCDIPSCMNHQTSTSCP